MPENKFLKDAQLIPKKLRLEGDSIRFSVKGTIPIESVLSPKNPKVFISFKGEKSQLDLEAVELKKNVSNYSYEKKISLKYEPWMSAGTLELSFYQGKREGQEPFEKKVLAKGVMTPQLMVKLGAVYPDEPIPLIGLFITSGVDDREIVRVQDFSLQFDLGSFTYKSNAENLKAIQEIDSFLTSNPDIQEIKITGIQSPEAGEGKNGALGMNRAESVKTLLGTRIVAFPNSKVKIDSRRNDWFDLRLLLGDYKGISTNRKEELYTILMNQESYLDQNERLKKVPGFSQVAQDLYPKLRVAKIEIQAKPRTGLDMQQSMKLREALSKTDGTNGLTLEEWALAAEASQSLEEKAVIYSKMTEFFRSALPYNNMAVVRIRQAQRTLDQQSKEILWEEALRLLTQAQRIDPNPYTFHNQGQVLALQGDHWEAYLKLSEASSLSQNPDFQQRNEALRGALDIVRGDYKLATLRFDYKFSDPRDYFNKGLAYYMIQDYVNATIAFEESVVQGRMFGYGFYGLAMIAAASGQNEIALIHLKKAIEANRQLSEKAYQDPLFEELRESKEFFSELSLN
ncbi:TPR end-of-group domain-containing protein [Algoriphagus sp.]|uniref:TPR end-of-group domain-containing protein n=1 Tax=Algoriphagus sp. TaxID=1872435 RepID=UPI00391B0EF1